MTDDTQVSITVDGRELKADPGVMLIEVTDAAGIDIPRFCYHKKLSIAANCRMCLVEVEMGGRPVPKPLPACATPVADGMVVRTRSPKALAAQQGTMEFLLINHPLDCPICDQGGECELQDVAMGYGGDVSRYVEGKRVVKDEDLGPLIATDMTRCIHCTRCVRFGAEVAGVRELGATGRGEHMRIGVYVSKTVDHELSGNIIDLCPVGALTSKPYRYQARAWELSQTDGIASHDAIGSNLHLHTRRNALLRVHPRDNEAVNETWISDRDRFSYAGLSSEDRLTTPMIKSNGQWRQTDWDEALQLAAKQLKQVSADDAGQLATLMSPRSTLEEMFLAQKITRGLGSPNIDCRLRQTRFSDAADALYPGLGLPLADLENAELVLVIGANLRKDQPLLAHRVRKAALAGAEVVFYNPLQQNLTHPATQVVAAPDELLHQLAGLAKGLGVRVAGAKGLVHKAKSSDAQKELGKRMKGAGKVVVLLGSLAERSLEFTVLKGLAHAIAEAAGGSFGIIPAAANSMGAHLAGALPYVAAGAQAAEPCGESAAELLANSKRVYLLSGFEPDQDCADAVTALATLQKADFVIALSAWRGAGLEQVADLLLPIGDFAETAGTYVNADGRWQSFQGVIAPPGEARPGWKVLRVLGNLLGLDGFDYLSAREIRDQLASRCEGVTPDSTPRGEWLDELPATPAADQLIRVPDLPMYSVDPLVRRAPALQQTSEALAEAAYLHPESASALGLEEGVKLSIGVNGAQLELPLILDQQLAPGCVRLQTPDGGPLSGPVTLIKA